ncbi:fibronectin type III domain-containing protein, partial [Paenibacillus sp. UMB4589-SE434]|uniref:fibronectin type III domain-containing protein n=1 Tax=Paenibacillus sp. UMB4589-SE434 TaxID=3046314 RepID=UPI00254CC0CE
SPAVTIQVTTDSGSVPDVTPPTAPTNVTVVSKTSNSVNLSWTASTDNVGVTGYTVTYGPTTVTAAGTSAAITGLSANTAYTFTIVAKDAAGNVSPAATIQVTTNANSGGVCASAWDAAAVYTGGNRVTYNGNVYEAKWWTKGERPDQGGDWGVWKLIGPCSSTPALIVPTERTESAGATIIGGAGLSPAFLSLSSQSALAQPTTAALPADKKVIVGYWHNFDNGSGFIRLRDVSPNFDVINISFAEPVSGPSGGTIGFTPYNYTEADFKADVKYLQTQGKKVMISIGGANGQVQLVSEQAKNNFVNSMTNIISSYGFDGLDIDFEGHSLYLNVGDKDFRSPTTPVITNLISAVRSLHNHFGDSFMVTMAPETFFVQVGHSFYGGNGNGIDSRAGAYLPVIYGLRDILDWLQVQHYNSGPITALDGTYYNMGDADFHVAMADMVLSGFTVANNPNLVFPALRQDQVVIGLPANVNAGGGYTSVAEVQKGLNYLMKGQSFNGRYKLANPAGYAGIRGLMTWSINWDKFNNFEFSSKHRTYLDSYQTGPDTQPPSVPANLQANGVTSNSVKLAWSASTDNVGVIAYDVYQGGVKTATVTGTTYQAIGLAADTTYSFNVRARDLAGNISSPSLEIQVKTLVENGDDHIPPTVPSNVQVTAKSATSVTLSWTPSTDNVGVVEYLVSYGAQTVNQAAPTVLISGLTPNTLYSFSITAKDLAGNVSPAATIQVTTDTASGTTAWKAGTAYKTNDEVTYNNVVYVCVQGHTSLQGWEPANVPALWRKK